MLEFIRLYKDEFCMSHTDVMMQYMTILIGREVLLKKLSNGVHLHDRLESTECLGYVSLS